MAARTCPISCRSISASTTCRWFRSPTISAARCRTRTSRQPFITASRSTCIARPAARRLRCLSRPHLAGEAARPRHRDCARARHSAEDRGQGRPRRRSLFPDEHRAAARRPRRRIHRRDQRASEDAIPGRGAGAAVSRRLAGAVRPLHDRGHGLRHAGPGVPLRLGAGDRRRRRHRRHRRNHGGGDRGACRASSRSTGKRCVSASSNAFPPHGWRRTMSASIVRCSSRRNPSAPRSRTPGFTWGTARTRSS